MSLGFEFDPGNKVLLVRVHGRLTDEVLAECYRAIRVYSVQTDARAGIFDFSGVTDFPISSEFIRQLARKEPAMPEGDKRPRVMVVPQTHGFGLARMFQMMGERTRPLFTVVKKMDQAFKVLDVNDPKFESLGPGA